jgi:hypothetical protein
MNTHFFFIEKTGALLIMKLDPRDFFRCSGCDYLMCSQLFWCKSRFKVEVGLRIWFNSLVQIKEENSSFATSIVWHLN